MTDSVVVEGYVKFRDGKKWKTRWVVIRKPSPVADCLVLLVFKDKSDKAQGHRERASFTLEDICGLETGQWFEGVCHTLAIICLAQATLLGFDSKETLHAWDIRIRYSLGEVHRFIVGVLPGTKLESGPASLHLCNNLLALARDTPPVVTGHWNLPDLRRYGPVPNGFVFEGGTRCGYWAGVFFLASTDGEQISFLFDCIVRGISPSRGPYGLQPVLPDPCSANKAHSEERANHEAQELEKRLSMLSHRSSTALSVYNPCLAGDDRSISGSSDTSDTTHSDCSIGSRLAVWPDPATGPSGSSIDHVGQTGPKVASQSSTEKLCIGPGGGCRAASKAPRQLQEIGRQSSSDSGIATGSHSSYTGSFSSYTGSLDISPGEDFGSILTLPPHLAADLSPCTCPPVPGHEYQVPTSLRYLYDTPRNVFQEGSGGISKETEPHTATEDCAGQPVDSSEPSEGSDCCPAVTGGSPPDTAETQPTTGPPQEPTEENRKSKVAPSCDSHHPDSCRICSSLTPASKTIFTICSACGGFKGTPYTPASCAVIPAIPDQSVDKSPCSSATLAQQPAKMFTTRKTAASSRWQAAVHSLQGAAHSSQKHEQKEYQETSQPKKGRDKLASLIAELLSYPKAGAAPVTKANQMTSSYESMRSALGREPESKSADGCAAASLPSDSQRDKRTSLYENNCFKCRGQNCHRPLHVPPCRGHSSTLHSCGRNCTVFGQPVPSGAWIRKTREHEVVLLEPVHGSGGARSTAGAPQFREEVNGHSVTFEDKKLNIKEERHKVDPAYEIMEIRAALEKNSETEDKMKYELMATYGQQRHFHESEGPVFVFPPEMPFPDRPRGGCGGDGVTYVNIPVSPTSKKELNYMELELQESSPGIRGAAGAHLPPQRKSSSKYAQIDITATETAHKVGTQHALCREEGLHTLDLRRRGVPQ